MNIIERIERKAQEMSDDPFACWFTDYKSNKDGQVYVAPETRGDQNQLLHRVAWEAHHAEPIPEGMVLLHICDNPSCFNPDHLVLGTQGDNNRDRDNKGRTVNKYQEFTDALALINDGWPVLDACHISDISFQTFYAHLK